MRNPFRAPTSQAVPRRAPAAVPTGRMLPQRLTYDQFVASQTWAKSQDILLAYYEVARNSLLSILNQPMRFFIKSKYVATISAPGSAGTQEVSLPSGVDLVKSTRTKPDLPSKLDPDVVAYISDDGSSWAATDVTAVDYDNNKVTVDVGASTTKIDIRYLGGNGGFKFVAIAPVGSDVAQTMLYNSPFKAMHEIDQASGITAPRIVTAPGKLGVNLGPKFRIGLIVNSKFEIVWDDDSKHEVGIPTLYAPVQVLNAQALNVNTQRALK